MQWQQNGVLIVDDKSRIDVNAVSDLLKESYWANERSKECMAKSIEYSLCFSVFKENKQIGFARVVTDYATFSWIADVIIDPRFRGQGVGKFLMQCVTEHPMVASTMQLLRTRDAHGLYTQYGFERNECMAKRPAE